MAEEFHKRVQRVLLTKFPPNDYEVISVIEITNMCEAFNVLPLQGGLMDQPAELITKIQSVLIVKNERHEKEMEESRRKSGTRYPRT